MNWKSLGPADQTWIESFGDPTRRRNWKDVPDCEPGVAVWTWRRTDVTKSKEEIVSALKVCSETRNLEGGKELHSLALSAGLQPDRVVAAALINMYCKCGRTASARDVFDKMSYRGRDVVTWTSLILGYVENGENMVAMDIFGCMDREPDTVTLVVAIKSCSALVDDKLFCLEKGIALHQRVKKLGYEANTVVINTLVAMYSKCGSMIHARAVFDRTSQRNVITWNSLISGYAENGECSVALDLYKAMDCQADSGTYVAVLKACTGLCALLDKEFCLIQGQAVHELARQRGLGSNILVANTLLDLYTKCGSMTNAQEAFDRMVHRDVVTWNCLISGYAQSGHSSVALTLFFSMDCKPNLVTLVAALKACATLVNVVEESERRACLEKGMVIYRQLKEHGIPVGSELVVANVLLDMYGKCGCVIEAQDVFDRMAQRNAVSWTCLMLGYVENGQSSIAIRLFMSMDCKPDSATFCAALKASGNLSSVGLGKMIHARICELGLEENERVVTGLVDFYGKCGYMSTAQHVFDGTPLKNVCMPTALMGGYSRLGDYSQVFSLATQVQEAGLQMDAITFVCMLTTCSHAGMVEEGRKCFSSMLETGISASVEHYNCIVDILSRAKRLQEAGLLINDMPSEAGQLVTRTLLGAYRR